MTTSVPASDVQKNFGLWHDKALREPVQITKYGRETTYLVSAEMFHEMWASYQQAKSTTELSDTEIAMIRQAQVPAEHDYEYDDEAGAPERPGKERPRNGRPRAR